MALSNILREPRREIIETLVGIAIFIIPVYLDYRFGLWFEKATGGPRGAWGPGHGHWAICLWAVFSGAADHPFNR